MFEKVNNECLKNLLKRSAGKKSETLFCQIADDTVYVCIGGTRMHVIPVSHCFFDASKIKEHKSLKNIFNDCRDNNSAIAEYTGCQITKEKMQLVEYKDTSGKRYYYQVKHLKEFGDIESLYLLVSGDSKVSPAVVRDKNNYIDYGIVCPVNI